MDSSSPGPSSLFFPQGDPRGVKAPQTPTNKHTDLPSPTPLKVRNTASPRPGPLHLVRRRLLEHRDGCLDLFRAEPGEVPSSKTRPTHHDFGRQSITTTLDVPAPADSSLSRVSSESLDLATSALHGKMSAPLRKKAKISDDKSGVFFLYDEGGGVPSELRREITRVRIAPQVKEIPQSTFYYCEKLSEIHFNEGLRVVGKWAFYNCKTLRRISLPSTVTELGERAFQSCTALRSVNIPSTVTELGERAFYYCINLSRVNLNEGLRIIQDSTFVLCEALRSLTLPSTVIALGEHAFFKCRNLAKLQFNEGLNIIGKQAFFECTALQSVTLPSTVTMLGRQAFSCCENLSEVILLGGDRLLNHDFFSRGFSGEEWGLLNQGALDYMLFHEYEFDERRAFAFRGCPLTAVKISISWAVSESMARLTPECRVSVEERIRNLPRLELMPNRIVCACLPVVIKETNDAVHDDDDTHTEVQDTNSETARSVYKLLQLIAFHELKESSILIELAMWKSRIDGDRARADCRASIPGPAKSLIMEYVGFGGFLRPAIEGA